MIPMFLNLSIGIFIEKMSLNSVAFQLSGQPVLEPLEKVALTEPCELEFNAGLYPGAPGSQALYSDSVTAYLTNYRIILVNMKPNLLFANMQVSLDRLTNVTVNSPFFGPKSIVADLMALPNQGLHDGVLTLKMARIFEFNSFLSQLKLSFTGPVAEALPLYTPELPDYSK
jgi:hypothetical protein